VRPIIYLERCLWTYIWFTFSLSGICNASHLLHWHMELCREPMVPTVLAVSYLVGYEGRRHGIALHCIYIMILGYEMCALEYGFGSYW